MSADGNSEKSLNMPYVELYNSLGHLRDELIELSLILSESGLFVGHEMTENTRREYQYILEKLIQSGPCV